MHITKLFYNIQTKECEFFVYSGCGGNANNFMSMLECESKCKKGSALLIEIPLSALNGKNNKTSSAQRGVTNSALFPNTNNKVYIKPYTTSQTQATKRTLGGRSSIEVSFGLIEEFDSRLTSPTDSRYIAIKNNIHDAVSFFK